MTVKNIVYNTVFLLVLTQSCYNVNGQFGDYAQDFGYVDVRDGAHMFYWMFYTMAPVQSYTERPLIVWLQGGPGASSTGIGNFEIMGPMDLSLQPRNFTWVNNFNVLYLDNPVGTGFSYVDNNNLLTTTNDQIALDFVQFMRGFYEKNPEFQTVPLYIFGQSYGGKMAVDMALRMKEAENEGTIQSNLRGIAMGNSWISPVDSTITWGPLLLAAGLVDQRGHDMIQEAAMRAKELVDQGSYLAATYQWSATQGAVFQATTSVDFYNILTKMPASPNTEPVDSSYSRANSSADDLDAAYVQARAIMLRDMPYRQPKQDEYSLSYIMNDLVKPALNIPSSITWQASSNQVFNTLNADFMLPVTDGIEKLLNETDITLLKYNGNLDLICDTPGQLLWVDLLKWPGAEEYRNAPRLPIWENGLLEGFYKSYGNFKFYWINVAGHSAPLHNPVAANAYLRDLTSFGLTTDAE